MRRRRQILQCFICKRVGGTVLGVGGAALHHVEVHERLLQRLVHIWRFHNVHPGTPAVHSFSGACKGAENCLHWRRGRLGDLIDMQTYWFHLSAGHYINPARGNTRQTILGIAPLRDHTLFLLPQHQRKIKLLWAVHPWYIRRPTKYYCLYMILRK